MALHNFTEYVRLLTMAVPNDRSFDRLWNRISSYETKHRTKKVDIELGVFVVIYSNEKTDPHNIHERYWLSRKPGESSIPDVVQDYANSFVSRWAAIVDEFTDDSVQAFKTSKDYGSTVDFPVYTADYMGFPLNPFVAADPTAPAREDLFENATPLPPTLPTLKPVWMDMVDFVVKQNPQTTSLVAVEYGNYIRVEGLLLDGDGRVIAPTRHRSNQNFTDKHIVLFERARIELNLMGL